jgi:hypothetical protein
MTKRHAAWTVLMMLAMETAGLAEHPVREAAPAMTVCLTFSDALAIDPVEDAVLAELNRIWQPLGVTVGSADAVGNACDRWILAKSHLEAGPEDAAGETAIAWVPFVAGRARRVMFVRVSYALALIDAFRPGIRPPGLTDLLLAKLLGRSMAHELGHILLNSVGHERSGLMRARYGAHDVLRDLPTGYTLNARELDRLFGRTKF